jgi:hypothetical protein
VAAELSVTAGIWEGCWLVSAVGEIDPSTASLLDQALSAAPRRLPIVLDLCSVVSIAPSALQSVLVERKGRRRLAVVRSLHASTGVADVGGANGSAAMFDDLLTAINVAKRRKVRLR